LTTTTSRWHDVALAAAESERGSAAVMIVS
jgi:hypothetical protein